MKRIFCLLLCAALILSLAGCAQAEPPAELLGQLHSRGCRNSWLGLGCILPKDWTVCPRERMLLPDGSYQSAGEEEAWAILDAWQDLYLLSAESGNGQTRLYISVRDYGTSARFLTPGDVAQFLQEDLTLTLTEEGCTILNMTQQPILLAGSERTGLVCMATEKQRAQCITAVVLQRDRYFVTVLASGKSQAAVNQALASFYSLNAAAIEL